MISVGGYASTGISLGCDTLRLLMSFIITLVGNILGF